LSIAALSFLIAVLGLGFGVVQMMNRPEPTLAAAPASAPEQAPVMVAASVGPSMSLSMAAVPPAVREIQASARVIDATYTVEAGDTLGRIATRYNTTVERIQAFNNIADARALRIGARLVIPPAL
jgi:LysM repeat protein